MWFHNCVVVWLVVGVFVGAVNAQMVGTSISDSGSLPNSNAMLDIQSPATGAGKGLLIPRITQSQRTSTNASLAGGLLDDSGDLRGGPAHGLIVYQTNGTQGFYYNTSTNVTPSWSHIGDSTGNIKTDGSVPMSGNLDLAGNSITNGSFVGSGAGLTGIPSTGITEADPVYSASPASGITSTDTSNWNEAYGWGDHSTNGYLTTEGDSVWTAASNLYYQATAAEGVFVDVAGDTMTGALLINDAASGTLKLDSAFTNIALGAAASAAGGAERIAIGHNVSNDLDNTARIRGDVYMDGGDAVYARSTFGSGSFKQLLPLPALQNVIYVATNGTSTGPGTIAQPFDTPQNGYDYAATTYVSLPSTLVIASGTYSGLNMNAGSVHVFGESRPELSALTVSSSSVGISGKQRVENLIVTGEASVTPTGGDVKFHNCRVENILEITGSPVEVQDCFVSAQGSTWAVLVYNVSEVALYNCSFSNNTTGNGTVVLDSVDSFEMIGCQIQNTGGGYCIDDQESGPVTTTHLYTHNYLNGAEPIVGAKPAMRDDWAGSAGPTITFTHNLVMGHVGISGHSQFYANNTVYGLINNVGGAGDPGWSQAGTGTGADAAGNIEHETTYPTLPSSWRD